MKISWISLLTIGTVLSTNVLKTTNNASCEEVKIVQNSLITLNNTTALNSYDFKSGQDYKNMVANFPHLKWCAENWKNVYIPFEGADFFNDFQKSFQNVVKPMQEILKKINLASKKPWFFGFISIEEKVVLVTGDWGPRVDKMQSVFWKQIKPMYDKLAAL